jgi:7,8-dihydropterin-6-yl-methyl-4-(beta-D-ribofuranosyl)aminobenzene 5'-phosphate synthase
MRIVTLIENLACKQGLVAEHGLSFYIETGSEKILFDTGQSGLFLQNAQNLGIQIEDIDSLILSHGHYDHSGGLYTFLEKNNKAKVYAKRGIFTQKYSDSLKFIGIHPNEALIENRIVYIENVTQIAEDVFIMPDIQIHHSVDTHFAGLKKILNGQVVPDEFDDELFVVLKRNEQINIVTACSHRGITNICTVANDYFKLPVNLILGGFHMKDCTPDQYQHIINYFRQLNPRSIGVCHCTGIEKFNDLNNDLEADVYYNYTGNEIIIK